MDIQKIDADHLTVYEQNEIKKFNYVYYYAPDTVKIHATKNKFNNNHGYDENNRYIYMINDHLNYRYQLLSKLGQGAFSDVFHCLDHKHNREVVVKVVKNEKI